MDPTYGGVQCTHNVNNRIDRHLLVARETLAPDLATEGTLFIIQLKNSEFGRLFVKFSRRAAGTPHVATVLG